MFFGGWERVTATVIQMKSEGQEGTGSWVGMGTRETVADETAYPVGLLGRVRATVQEPRE